MAMFILPFLAILSALIPPVFAEGSGILKAQTVSGRGYISIWIMDRSTDPWALPQPIESARTVSFELGLPVRPGQAVLAERVERFRPEGQGELKVKLSFYSLCPGNASEGCPEKYFQVQAELSGAVNAFCAASLNTLDFLPFPVLVCAGDLSRDKKLGITLHRSALFKGEQ